MNLKPSLLSAEEIEEINLFVMSRAQKLVLGEHTSVFLGTSGFDFAGIRNWEPGDPESRIDWPHSSYAGFDPLMVREYVEERSLDVMIAADVSLSARCGVQGVSIGSLIAQTIGIIGFSAVFFSDSVGLLTFDVEKKYGVLPPRGGRNHLYGLLDSYNELFFGGAEAKVSPESLSEAIAGALRKPSFITVISDFLFEDAESVVYDIAKLKASHDVVLIIIDAAFAFKLPKISSGWLKTCDIETGECLTISRGEIERLCDKIKHNQDTVMQIADRVDLEAFRLPPKKEKLQAAMAEFFLGRRLQPRK